MRRFKTALAAVAVVALSTGVAAYTHSAFAGVWPTEKQCKKVAKDGDDIIDGWRAAISSRGGNCLACHQALIKPWPEGFPPGGNIGPPFVGMAARFPNRDDLRAQIWDATVKNSNTSMPPFGRHKLVSEKSIDYIVDWLLSF